jgi:hypothetical protein
MPNTFYGKWSLKVSAVNDKVVGVSGTVQERIRIAGSQGSDGPIAGVVGNGIAAIDGTAWEVYMEWSNDGGATWSSNLVQRTPSVTPSDGLIVTLYAWQDLLLGPVPGTTPPEGFNLVAQFVYLNRQVNPLGPNQPVHSFTLPASSFRPQRPAQGDSGRCCCECICTCHQAKRSKGCS